LATTTVFFPELPVWPRHKVNGVRFFVSTNLRKQKQTARTVLILVGWYCLEIKRDKETDIVLSWTSEDILDPPLFQIFLKIALKWFHGLDGTGGFSSSSRQLRIILMQENVSQLE